MISCEQGPSLQQYFVEKMEDPSFLILNLPIQLDSIFQKDITAKDRELISSIGKLNLLFYKKDNNHP